MTVYLSLHQVLKLHNEVFKRYGGLAGIRDIGLLSSALEIPKTSFSGSEMYPTIYEKASAYLYHLVCNHPFNDANKRTGCAVVLVFLRLNKAELRIFEEHLEFLVVEVAKGSVDKKEIVCWLRKEPNEETLQ